MSTRSAGFFLSFLDVLGPPCWGRRFGVLADGAGVGVGAAVVNFSSSAIEVCGALFRRNKLDKEANERRRKPGGLAGVPSSGMDCIEDESTVFTETLDELAADRAAISREERILLILNTLRRRRERETLEPTDAIEVTEMVCEIEDDTEVIDDRRPESEGVAMDDDEEERGCTQVGRVSGIIDLGLRSIARCWCE